MGKSCTALYAQVILMSALMELWSFLKSQNFRNEGETFTESSWLRMRSKFKIT